MEQSDLNTCRSVRYTKGWRKGAVKCGQCGFWFVPDEQDYPLYDGEPMQYLTGAQWFETFKCCPNCLPAEPAAPFGKRRCLGQRHRGTWARKCGCGIFFTVSNKYALSPEWRKSCRLSLCIVHKQYRGLSQGEIRNLKSFVKGMDHVPTLNEWRQKRRVLSASKIMRHFGSWCNFTATFWGVRRIKGGRPEGPGHRYSEKYLLDFIRQVYEQCNCVPSIRKWRDLKLRPSATTIERRFGSWNSAWSSIGATPNESHKEWYLTHPQEWRLAMEKGWRLAGKVKDIVSPTARDMWLASHGQASESTKRYLDAVEHHKEKLDEQERIFKEHQFKSAAPDDPE